MMTQHRTASNLLSQTATSRPPVKSFTPEILAQAKAIKLRSSKHYYVKLIGNLIEGASRRECRASHDKMSMMLAEGAGKYLRYTATRNLGRWLVSSGMGFKIHRDGKANSYELTELGWAYFYLDKKRIPNQKLTPPKTKSDTVSKNLIYDLNIQDLTYIEDDVCLFNNLEKREEKERLQGVDRLPKPKLVPKPKLRPPPKPQSRHISESRLNGNNPDREVIRVCIAWLLSESDIKYAVMRMRQRETIKTTPARFLASMASKLAKGEWSKEGLIDPGGGHRDRLEMRAREARERELEREREKLESEEIEAARKSQSVKREKDRIWEMLGVSKERNQ